LFPGEILGPEVSFANQLYHQQHDARLQLAVDTYVQLIIGAGMSVKASSKAIKRILDDWFDDIDLEEKIENGLPSYVGAGNMLFEIEKRLLDIVEISLPSVKGVKRNKRGKTTEYIQEINSKEIPIPAKDVIHFQLTNTGNEVFGRGIYYSLIAPKHLPVDGSNMLSALETQWLIEDAMGLVIRSYASPIMMIHFKDAGEEFIKKQSKAFAKLKPGAKIITDKEFEIKVFEVNPNSKFDKYIEHIQKNIIEPGSQFPLGFFNAQFTARASSETTDNVLIRKIKRIQRRLGRQIRDRMAIPYLKSRKKKAKNEDVTILFEFESKVDVDSMAIINLFEKGGIKRSELRHYLDDKTTFDIDTDDFEDTAPITSVTPTNDLLTSQPSDAAQGNSIDKPQDNKMEMEMENLRHLVEERIPKPRGRPKDLDIDELEEKIKMKKLEILTKAKEDMDDDRY